MFYYFSLISKVFYLIWIIQIEVDIFRQLLIKQGNAIR